MYTVIIAKKRSLFFDNKEEYNTIFLTNGKYYLNIKKGSVKFYSIDKFNKEKNKYSCVISLQENVRIINPSIIESHKDNIVEKLAMITGLNNVKNYEQLITKLI